MPLIDEQLQKAYQQAHYYVFEPPLLLRIGENQPALDQLLAKYQCQGAAFITAFNPRSMPLSVAENEHRQRVLLEQLDQSGWLFYKGQGLDPQGKWPPEEAVLILGINQNEALSMGQSFDQNAVVYHHLGSTSELLWCR